MQIKLRTKAAGLLGLMALALAGCGTAEGTVSGTVKFRGQPLTVGDNTVTFLGEDGSVKSCTVEPDGRYTLRGVHAGRAHVTVHALPPPPNLRMAPGEDGQMKPVGESGQPAKAGQFAGIPDRYKDPDKSELTCDVRRGDQTFDIELKP
jgi:hypothetical protein